MTLLFATAGAAAVGNLYWAQPLLGEIARTLDVSVAASGALTTVTQLGYALGVPLLAVLLAQTADDKAREALPYGQLLASIVAAVRGSRPVQVTLVLGGCVFAVFMMSWTGLTFLLTSKPAEGRAAHEAPPCALLGTRKAK
jgi:MFS family permease